MSQPHVNILVMLTLRDIISRNYLLKREDVARLPIS